MKQLTNNVSDKTLKCTQIITQGRCKITFIKIAKKNVLWKNV